MAKRYSDSPKGITKGLKPIPKAVYVATKHYETIRDHRDDMVSSYRAKLDKIATDPEYAQEVYTRYITKLATWYQAIEDVNLSLKFSQIMALAKKRAREIKESVERDVIEYLEKTVPGYKKPKKLVEIEILAR